MADINDAVAYAFAKDYTSGTWANSGTTGAALDATVTGAQIRAHDGTNYFRHPGIAGNYLSAPDSAALSITGDIDIRWVGSLDDIASPSTVQQLITKWATGQDNYGLSVRTNGDLRLSWTEDGSTLKNESVATPFTAGDDGNVVGIRVTMDVDDGASDAQVRFYTLNTPASDDPTNAANWTQTGTDQAVGATTSIDDGTSPVEIGSQDGGAGNPLTGNTYRALIYDGIAGTLVFDVNADSFDGGTVSQAKSFTEESSNAATVTVNVTSGAGYKLWLIDRQTFELDGTNDRIEIPDHDDIDFNNQDAAFGLACRTYDWTHASADMALMAKRVGGAGYAILTDFSAVPASDVRHIYDGATFYEGFTGNPTDGANVTLQSRADVDATLDGFEDGVKTVGDTFAGSDDARNAGKLYLGYYEQSTLYNFTGLIWAYYVYRGAPTDGEMGAGEGSFHYQLLNQTNAGAGLGGYWGLRVA